MNRPSLDAPEYLSSRETAAFIGINIRTLAGWRLRRVGPSFVRVSGNVVRYDRAVLQRWLDARCVACDEMRGAA